ncbi:hypothetical protein E2C01_033954 [Portunus trituberculatus]|uniref:Uncharacterized protein n=1 Tax=Portunus trituberculatus TaxID=210409 RepID=A0A5B7F5H0_PORTR|nr:hypothetical protein [Portunus trituberculatus]
MLETGMESTGTTGAAKAGMQSTGATVTEAALNTAGKSKWPCGRRVGNPSGGRVAADEQSKNCKVVPVAGPARAWGGGAGWGAKGRRGRSNVLGGVEETLKASAARRRRCREGASNPLSGHPC